MQTKGKTKQELNEKKITGLLIMLFGEKKIAKILLKIQFKKYYWILINLKIKCHCQWF